ncbi:MAG: glycosyltransferase, partial [Desulfurococcales archaeon]|nr:glycosyltransferase [Desulfurococcales archaeon]
AGEGVRVKRLRLSRNYGFVGGNNFAYRFRDRRSKYVVLLNNDAIALRDSLRRMVEFMEGDPSVGAAQGVILRPGLKVDSAGAFVTEFMASLHAYSGCRASRVRRPFYATYASGAYSIYRVEALRRAGLGDRLFDWEFFAYHDDNVLGLRLWQSGYRVAVIPHVTAIHVGNATFGRYTFKRLYHSILGVTALNEAANSRFKGLNRLLILLFALRASLLSLATGGASRGQTPIKGFIDGLRIAARKREKIDLYRAPIPSYPPWITVLSTVMRRLMERYLLKIDPQEAFRYRGSPTLPPSPAANG